MTQSISVTYSMVPGSFSYHMALVYDANGETVVAEFGLRRRAAFSPLAAAQEVLNELLGSPDPNNAYGLLKWGTPFGTQTATGDLWMTIAISRNDCSRRRFDHAMECHSRYCQQL